MKRILFHVVFLCLLVVAVPALAQETKDCGVDSIKNQMNELVANYLSAQTKATDAKSVLAAATDLQTRIAALTADCAKTASEATSEPTSTGMPVAGKWMWTWHDKTKSCPAEKYTEALINHPVSLYVSEDGKGLVLNDLFLFGEAEFKPDKNGNYSYLQNVLSYYGYPLSFTYVLYSLNPESITGSMTDYVPGTACESLRSDFTLTLVDTKVMCMVGSGISANLRSGPGTTFDRFGTLAVNQAVDVEGYALNPDGFKWWKLASGGWVRSDLVEEAGRCDQVPEIKPD